MMVKDGDDYVDGQTSGVVEVEGKRFVWILDGQAPNQMIEVKAVEDSGQPKVTQLGGMTPDALARMLARELLEGI